MKIFNIWEKFNKAQKTIFFLCSFSFFFCLGSYPAIRSLAQSLFLEHAGVVNRPFAWMLTVIVLIGVIGLFNYLQKTFYVQKLHRLVALLSVFLFGGSYLAMEAGQAWGAYSFFIWKEIYIVLFVGFVITFCNNFFTESQAKILYGPYGAIGSVGAVLGGLLTTYLSKQGNLHGVFIFALMAIILASVLFSFTGKTHKSDKEEEREISPLMAIKDVKLYVFFMCLLIASTQFAINSASQIFYILLEANMPDKFERTAYLGQIFSTINGVALVIQLLIMPWLLNFVSNKTIHYFIPLFFLVAMGAIGGGIPLFLAGGLFISFKAIDYSLFSVVKELLYFPLSKIQKYGAKYITDILVYRSSKIVLALVLLQFSAKGEIYTILISSLILWILAVFLLYKYQDKQKNKKDYDK